MGSKCTLKLFSKFKGLLLLLIPLLNNCHSNSPTFPIPKQTTGYNTSIVIHYGSEKDREFSRFQQYDSFGLRDFGIIDPPAFTSENHGLQTTLKFNIDEPHLLLLGFTEFHIVPDTKLDLSYSVVKETKTELSEIRPLSFRVKNVAYGFLKD